MLDNYIKLFLEVSFPNRNSPAIAADNKSGYHHSRNRDEFAHRRKRNEEQSPSETQDFLSILKSLEQESNEESRQEEEHTSDNVEQALAALTHNTSGPGLNLPANINNSGSARSMRPKS